jgi:hypothetical protein
MRRVYFSFHCDDDQGRADVVLRSWRDRRPEATPAQTFRDSRVWQEAKERGDEDVKRLIREGIDRTSVTCVLAGTRTWQSRWARYEIARSVERGSGLLSVRINGIADARTRQASASGWNPLSHVGVGKAGGGRYFIFENVNGQWMRYQEHAAAVEKPSYLPDMSEGYVQPLSTGLVEYDYVAQDGRENLGGWIELAAQRAGKA